MRCGGGLGHNRKVGTPAPGIFSLLGRLTRSGLHSHREEPGKPVTGIESGRVEVAVPTDWANVRMDVGF